MVEVHRYTLEWIHYQLVFCYFKTRRKQTFCILQFVRNIQQPLAMLAMSTNWQCDFHRLLWSYLQILNPSTTLRFAIVHHGPLQIVGRKVTEEILVINAHDAFIQIHCLCPDILIIITYLIHVRIRHAVWTYQTIVAEVLITGIEFVEVATISINHLSVLTCPTDRLIHKVPDETTLILRILADNLPILLEATLRITHGMSILALNQRFVLRCILAVSHCPIRTQVHWAIDIRQPLITSTLVLHRTARIFCLCPLIGLLKVLAIASLIAKRPEDNAWMIEVALYITLVALHVCLLIIGTLGQCSFPITHAVALNVSLSYHIDTILITQVIPIIIIWIVTSTHRIEVEFLHDLNIL